MSITKVVIALILYTTSISSSNASEKITVVTEEWSPYNFLLNDNTISGIATERVKRVMKQAQLDYSITLYPWARAYNLALKQPNTLIYSIVRSPERNQLFHWLCPLIPTPGLFFFALKDNSQIKINQLDDAKAYTVGTTRNDFFTLYLHEKGFTPGKNLYISANDDISIAQLINNKVDLIIDSHAAITARLNKIGGKKAQVRALFKLETIQSLDICMALNLATPIDTVNKISKALKQVNAQNQTYN